MTLKRTLLFGALLLVVGITLLQFFVNWEGSFGGKKQEEGREKFRVGFLPVT